MKSISKVRSRDRFDSDSPFFGRGDGGGCSQPDRSPSVNRSYRSMVHLLGGGGVLMRIRCEFSVAEVLDFR